MFGMDVERLTEEATAPFLAKLDGLQSTLDAILEAVQRRDDEISRIVDWQLKHGKR